MSRGFRDEAYSWMLDEVGSRFSAFEEIELDCARSVGCSRATAAKWISRFTKKKGPYKIVTESEGKYVIRPRD